MITLENSVHDNLIENPEVQNIGVISGGGSNGIWAWDAVKHTHRQGYPFKFISGTSTGAIVAFMYAKGLIEEGDQLYKQTYEQGSKNIFESGIAQVQKGKLDIRWLKALPKLFNLKSVQSLMTNKGLYETFLALHKKQPDFPVADMFWTTYSLRTGQTVQHSSQTFKGSPEDWAASLTASTAMPGILPPRSYAGYEVMVDGGMTRGLPVDGMWDFMDKSKPYRIFTFEINPEELQVSNSLNNIAQYIGRTVTGMLNANLKSSIGRLNDRNAASKVIWPVSDDLEGLLAITEQLRTMNILGHADTLESVIKKSVDTLRSTLGYKYVPVQRIKCSLDRGVFDFTMESYDAQRAAAPMDVDKVLANMK